MATSKRLGKSCQNGELHFCQNCGEPIGINSYPANKKAAP
jgi:RNA polymerase-binding transcription factor DksA